MSVFAIGIELEGEGGHLAAWRCAEHPPSESLGVRTLLRPVRPPTTIPAARRADHREDARS
jgi:hypothetical protein